ncbi:MAG: Ig-like domain-containing protein [Bacteroidota bacterium]|nr:Ig-like domain-containing protein [Bacteroidota bacterium]MDP4234652.1 Ig-like domain-containing protein [Bacteroidota bacterium]MDP4243817.1 Ig-like domain-containing protein [Bacteroidota bacterium]MDP4288592.1 Ig-like domain-containing protein [Bacteroidota bacterium]
MTNDLSRVVAQNPLEMQMISLRSIALVIYHLSFVVLIASCASQQPPPGGPADTTRPKIDTTMPHNRQLNVPRDTRIYFRFDRDVDRASFAQAFSIQPYLTGQVTYHWSGHDEVTVKLPEKLRDSTTYTVQLSRDLKSQRGNNLAFPIRITFSTGPFIDTGTLSGFLLNPISGPSPKASEVFIFSYDISTRNADTLNVSHTMPDLLTQPNDQGIWQLLSMKVGHRYRVFAVEDVYRNHLYDAGVDAFGVPTGDAILDSVAKGKFYIRMAPASDTIRPELLDAEALDSFHIRAHFSEAIDSNDVIASNFTLNGKPLAAAYRESPDKKPGQITLLTTSPLAVNQDDSVAVRKGSIHDLSHNPISDSAYTVDFTTPSSLRVMHPPTFISIGIRDSAVDQSTMPVIPIIFSDVVRRDSIESAIALLDSGKHAMRARLHWLDDSRVLISPTDSLLPNLLYMITLRTRGILSPIAAISGPVRDTLFRWRFRTIRTGDLAKLSGKIAIEDSFFTQNPAGALIVQAINTSSNELRQIALKHGELEFVFEGMREATYRVRAFFSRTGDPIYDAGSVLPWRFGVPTGDYPQLVSARMRWTTKNIDFEVR